MTAATDVYALMKQNQQAREAELAAAKASAPKPNGNDSKGQQAQAAAPMPPAETAKPIQLITPPADLLTRIFPAHEFASFPRVPMKCVTALISEGGAGKSTLQLDMLLHVAAGLPFLGLPVKRGRVCYFSAEDDQAEVWRRVQKLARKLEPDDAARALQNFALIDAVGVALPFVGKDHGGIVKVGKDVDRIADAIGTAVLVAVDTLSRVNGGEENSNEVMAHIVTACERIAQRTGAAVVILHHTSKAAAREQMADLHAGRGGSALGDNARSVVRLMPASAGDVKGFADFDPDAIARGDILRLIHAKCSYARKAGDVWLRRCEDGTLEEFRPNTRDVADVAEEMLRDLIKWWIANDREPFSRTSVTECKGKLKAIWPANVSQGAAKSFFDAQISSNTILPTPDVKLRGGAAAFTLNAATAESLLAKVTQAEQATGTALEVAPANFLDLPEVNGNASL